MERLMEDLNSHGQRFEGMAKGQAFDVIGGFLNSTTDMRNSTLCSGTINVGGMNDYKFRMALLLMLQSNIDVLTITDVMSG